MVFQEQSLLLNMTVAENIYLAQEAAIHAARPDRPPAVHRGGAAAARQGRARHRARRGTAGELSFAARQMVELAKALALEERTDTAADDPARRADLGA